MFNRAIAKNTYTEIIRSKLRMSVLLLLFGLPIIGRTLEYCSRGQLPKEFFTSSSYFTCIVLVWGSGTIGRQLADGTLALVLSRPVTISTFVITKWLTIAAASTATALVQLFSEAVIGYFWSTKLDAGTLSAEAAERTLVCFGFASVLMLLSSLVSGVKDLGLYLLLILVQAIVGGFSHVDKMLEEHQKYKAIATAVARSAEVLGQLLGKAIQPNIDLPMYVAGGIFPSYDLCFYLAVIATSLSLAILVLIRKELPYGSA